MTSAGAPPQSTSTVEAATVSAARSSRRPGWARSLNVAIPAGLLALILSACFLWPLVGPVPSPVGGSVMNANLPPLTRGHLLGTGPTGYDIWSRLLYGGRVSLGTAVAVTVIGLVVGGVVGSLSAYWGGKVDAVIMRVLDVLLAFPALVLALVIAQGLGPSQRNVILAISFLVVPLFARVARAATLRLREEPFMTAAHLSGVRSWRVLLRHVGPNIFPQLLTFAMLGMGIIIIVAGSLSFLGLGIPPPKPSWGNMIYVGQQSLATNPTLVLFPSVMLCITIAAFNVLGEALRRRWSQQ